MDSGFDRNDNWGYRALEPNRCCVTSIALVLLKTGITHAAPLSNLNGPKPAPIVNATQLATAQKLLLFWRKPAVRSNLIFTCSGSGNSDVRTAEMLVGCDRRRGHWRQQPAGTDQGLGTADMDTGDRSVRFVSMRSSYADFEFLTVLV